MGLPSWWRPAAVGAGALVVLAVAARCRHQRRRKLAEEGEAAKARDLEAMLEASDKALAYLELRVLDAAWVAKHEDVAFYFKAPLAFLLAGRPEQAKAAFEALRPYLKDAGAASGNAAYRQGYPHYPLMWAARSASLLGEAEAAAACDVALGRWRAEGGAGLVQGGDEDFFATAMLAFNALTFGRLAEAQRAADILVRVTDANAGRGVFHLRWDRHGTLVAPPGDGALPDVFYKVDAAAPGQLYFMLAFPAMVLFELADRLGGERAKWVADYARAAVAYARAAGSLGAFLSSCNGVRDSMMAHKAAVSAAMAGDQRLARAIAAHLVSQQRAHGGFAEEADAMDTADQTAEIACWLRLVPKLIQRTVPNARCFEPDAVQAKAKLER